MNNINENLNRITTLIKRVETKNFVITEQNRFAGVFDTLLAGVEKTELRQLLPRDVIEHLAEVGIKNVHDITSIVEELNRLADAALALSPKQMDALLSLPNSTFRRNFFGMIYNENPEFIRELAKDVTGQGDGAALAFLHQEYPQHLQQELISFAKDATHMPQQKSVTNAAAHAASSAAAPAATSAGTIATATGTRIARVAPSQYDGVLKSFQTSFSKMYGVVKWVIAHPKTAFAGGVIGIPLAYSLLHALVEGVIGENDFITDFTDTFSDDAVSYLSTIATIYPKMKIAIQKRKEMMKNKPQQQTTTDNQPPSDESQDASSIRDFIKNVYNPKVADPKDAIDLNKITKIVVDPTDNTKRDIYYKNGKYEIISPDNKGGWQ